MKYHKIYHAKKAKTDDEEETVLPGIELEQKKKKRMTSKLIPNLLSCPTHLCGILVPKNVVKRRKVKRNSHPACMMASMHT